MPVRSKQGWEGNALLDIGMSLDFPVDQISTLTANWFILSLVSN